MYVSKGVPFLRSQNVWNDGIRLDEVVYINSETHYGMRNTQVLPNDILLNITGASLGRCSTVPEDFPTANVSQHVTIIRPLLADIRHFIRFCLLSPFGQQMIWGRQVGMAREGLSKKVLELFEIPLPPLAEQKRIVAKVDELMALCDQLEAQQQERERRFPVLSRTCHARFAENPTPDNLNCIFDETGTVSPEDLRKTILALAVQGRIVSQDSNDEPAEAILRRIHTEYSPKRDANGSNASEELEELPFALPNGWSASRVGSILDPKRGISYGVIKLGADPQQGGVYILRCSNVRFRRVDLHGIRKITEQLSSEYGRTILKGGEVLINVRGTLGGCAVVPPALRGYNIAREVALIPVHSEIDATFLLNVIASPYFQDRVNENLRGIAYEGLNLGLLRNFLIPIPPLAEQRRIVAKVDELMTLVDQLGAQQRERDKLAAAFAKACVASFTGTTQLERPEKMKAPKTELVSLVTLGKKPRPEADASLARLLIQNKGTLPAKSLWQQSGLAIDAFYQQLKTEIAQGWIAPPVEAEMRVLEQD